MSPAAGGSSKGPKKSSPAATKKASATAAAKKPAARVRDLSPDQRAALEEELRFLRRSLVDLDREHDAGDLDDADYATLKEDYAARVDKVRDAIEGHRAAVTAARGTAKRGRVAAVSLLVVVVAILAGWLVARSSGERKAGQTITGAGASLSPTERAQQCNSQFATGNQLDVLKCFEAVLKDDPGNPTALTYEGWVLYRYGTMGNSNELEVDGAKALTQAVKADPTFADPHLFLAVIARDAKQYPEAAAELATAQKLGLPAAQQSLIDALQTSITSGLSGTGTTTSTTSVATTTTTVP